MNFKKIDKTSKFSVIKKAVLFLATVASLYGCYRLGVSTLKAWDYDTFKQHHYAMDALKGNEAELKQVQKIHKDAQAPIKGIFGETYPNRCPICGGRD